MIRKSRIVAPTAALLIAVTPTILFHNGAQAATASSSTGNSALALTDFSSQIETLGVEQYPDSFAGAVLTPAGVTDAYISNPSDTSMISAFRSLDTSNYPLQFIDTKLSYNQLDALNQKVEAANVQFKNEGIFLTQSDPDPESGTVVVDIKQPSTASFSELATASGSTVTAASYTADVSGILQAKFGSSVTLGQETAVQAAVAGRDNDLAPFYDGDGIVNLDNGVGCTGGFNVLNHGGQPFMLTDGHCGSGQWATEGEVIGNTNVNWHSPTSGYDIQAISEPIEGIGSVWTDYGNRASVTGTVIPAKGDGIVVNGAVTLQKGTVVNSVDVIIYNIGDEEGGYYFNAAHQIVMGANSTAVICQQGDSGGPVYVNHSTPVVDAAGMIETYFYNNQNPSQIWGCTATMITAILQSKDLTLVTG